ncbi:MAG: two-component sensor kinase [Candidatus Scalindua rubra]|uniref:histidine kinase n=1 Tax=Candidatus Scalindua rubra TaxID=1872076 RepID=A0A1E3XCY1_9BACT|nr:MAG: two-component sensor kinase [Candidatus Scalindua rubra]
MRILIVDDNKEFLNLLETMLRNNGYEVVPATNGVEALEKLYIEHIDLIISDILMPKMDGFQLCIKVKADKKMKDIPLVFYTSVYTDEEDEAFALKVGADKFIRKPLEMDNFMNIIRDLCKDANKIKVGSSKHIVEDDKQTLKLYNELLVNKLEQKMLYIEKEITERKRVEKALRESEDKLRTISNSANNAIIMIDNEGKITFWNEAAEKVFKYSSKETVGRNLYEFVVPERMHKNFLNGFKRFQDTGQGPYIGKTVELMAVKKGGTEFPIEHSVSAVKIKGKWIALGIIRDITERKQSEEKLRVSYKMASLGRLTAGIFHEVLNPVNIISSHVQLLLMEAEKGSKTEEDLKSIQEEIGRIVKISDGLLRFARKGEYTTEEAEVNSLLEKVLSIIEPDMKLENVKIIRRFEEGLPKIMANSDELRQVFLNLITNARDAMPDDGTLTISTQRIQKEGNSFISIRFMDTGCGIAKESLDRVFDPFFTTKGEGKGVGLGMSTSYGIIENHDGTMSVESEEGKGATFIIDLPVKT